jgi:hypothetical protein
MGQCQYSPVAQQWEGYPSALAGRCVGQIVGKEEKSWSNYYHNSPSLHSAESGAFKSKVGVWDSR